MQMPSGSKHRAHRQAQDKAGQKTEGTKSCLKAVKFKVTHTQTGWPNKTLLRVDENPERYFKCYFSTRK